MTPRRKRESIMTITEQFKAKRCVFSVECFPPKQTTQLEKLQSALREMGGLHPDFISVTFRAVRPAASPRWKWRTSSRRNWASRRWPI